MIEPSYRYRAKLNRVIDGDTFILDVDLGFRIFAAVTIRLHGWDTPERNETGNVEATKLTQALLTDSTKPIVIETYKDQKSFDRWIADVYVGGESLGQKLLDAGLAVKYP